MRVMEEEVMAVSRRPRTPGFIWLAVLMLIIAGCAEFGKALESPRIRLANIQVLEVRALETIFEIELRVLNTNDVPILVTALDCDLELNGKTIASGISEVEKEIPSHGTALVPVKIYSSVVDMFKGLLGLQGQETLKYKVTGRVHVEGGFLMPSVLPFVSAGELPLKDAPLSS